MQTLCPLTEFPQYNLRFVSLKLTKMRLPLRSKHQMANKLIKFNLTDAKIYIDKFPKFEFYIS